MSLRQVATESAWENSRVHNIPLPDCDVVGNNVETESTHGVDIYNHTNTDFHVKVAYSHVLRRRPEGGNWIDEGSDTVEKQIKVKANTHVDTAEAKRLNSALDPTRSMSVPKVNNNLYLVLCYTRITGVTRASILVTLCRRMIRLQNVKPKFKDGDGG